MKYSLLIVCLVALLLNGAVVFAGGAMGGMTHEEGRKIVQPLYDLLNGEDAAERVRANFAADWKSFYGNGEQNFKPLDQTIGFMSGPLRQMIPDLTWEIKDVLVTGDGHVVVRGQAAGTPAGGALMGQPAAEGKSFVIMSIDIHKVVDGKVVTTHHIENWNGAFAQIRPE